MRGPERGSRIQGNLCHGETAQSVRARLARALRAWRKEHNLPLKAIALEVGVSIETVSAWEAGEQFPTPERLDQLSRFTGLPACRFFCHRSGHCRPECGADSGLG